MGISSSCIKFCSGSIRSVLHCQHEDSNSGGSLSLSPEKENMVNLEKQKLLNKQAGEVTKATPEKMQYIRVLEENVKTIAEMALQEGLNMITLVIGESLNCPQYPIKSRAN